MFGQAVEGSSTMTNTTNNNSPRQSGSAPRRIGVKHLAEATGCTMLAMRKWLRRRYGRHQCWELWLFTEEEAAEIIKKKRPQNGGAKFHRSRS